MLRLLCLLLALLTVACTSQQVSQPPDPAPIPAATPAPPTPAPACFAGFPTPFGGNYAASAPDVSITLVVWCDVPDGLTAEVRMVTGDGAGSTAWIALSPQPRGRFDMAVWRSDLPTPAEEALWVYEVRVDGRLAARLPLRVVTIPDPG